MSRRILSKWRLQWLPSPSKRSDYAHNGTIMTDMMDTVRGAYMTQVKILERRAYVFITVDCSSEFVGQHASFSATSREALEPTAWPFLGIWAASGRVRSQARQRL